MYQRILVALENSPADRSIIEHVCKLALLTKSRLLLLHVADGWAARNFDQLKLAESAEMKEDREYLEGVAAKISEKGLEVATLLALGNPPDEILRTANSERCDLIAMTTHGHRFIGDLIHGSTIAEVRHQTSIPMLLVRAGKV